MADTTRRRFLASAGLGTAAGVAAVAIGPAGGAAAEEVLPENARGPMAAYIYDLRAGEVAIMIEGDQVVIKDRRLVARLANAFARVGSRGV